MTFSSHWSEWHHTNCFFEQKQIIMNSFVYIKVTDEACCYLCRRCQSLSRIFVFIFFRFFTVLQKNIFFFVLFSQRNIGQCDFIGDKKRSRRKMTKLQFDYREKQNKTTNNKTKEICWIWIFVSTLGLVCYLNSINITREASTKIKAQQEISPSWWLTAKELHFL